VERYVRAWNSNDPDEIGSLFTQAAEYRHTPFAEPWQGRDEIVRQWLARRDEPGDTTFRYEVVAVTGDTGVVRGWTRYVHSRNDYSNIWLIAFGTKRRCKAFTEWWVQRPQNASRQR
jgi:hypothetical protein